MTAAAADATRPGQMVAIMGTSTCHVMSSDQLAEVPGMCGVVDGGIIDGLWGYEAGQSAVGDIFGWFVDNCVPPAYVAEAERRGDLACTRYLEELAAEQPVGAHGLIALDWHNGNRSILVDHDLSAVLVGQTLATRPEDGYRALIEGTAFGTRRIVEAFEEKGVAVEEFIVAGGLLKNRLLMQIYSDVLRRPISVVASDQGPALGSAIHAAVAAGTYPDVPAAAASMGRRIESAYRPDTDRADRYDLLYAEYRGTARLLRRRGVRRQRRTAPAPQTQERGDRVTASAAVAALRGQVAALHTELVRYGLVAWTAGNISGRVPGEDLFVIKPSGISYDDLAPDSIVVCDLDGNLVEGDLSPSSDTAAHAYVYRARPDVGGVVHTHSTYATAWAARNEPIPCVLTAMADEFGGEIPVGPFALIGDDSIGQGIVETLAESRSPAVLMRNHGVFTIGKDARAAVKAAVMCEDVARTVHIARSGGPLVPIDPAHIDSLYHRYQTVYGQR